MAELLSTCYVAMNTLFKIIYKCFYSILELLQMYIKVEKTEFLHSLHPGSSNGNVFHNHDTLIKPEN